MIQKRKQTTIRITCKRYTPHNHQHTDKLFASVEPDMINVWCRWCRAPHPVEQKRCRKKWDSGDMIIDRVTCNVIGMRNPRGEDRDVAFIAERGMYVWCKYCARNHFLTEDRCLQAWEKLRAEEARKK